MRPIILPELYSLILRYLPQKQLLQLKLVNKQFKSIIDKIAANQLSHIKSLFTDEIEQLKYICRNGNYLLIGGCFQNMNKNVQFWNDMMYGACLGGHMEIVKYMIEKGANNWNVGLYDACEGGHMEIVNFIIKKGADGWNWGLRGACQGGHMEIVKLIIEKGATECAHCRKPISEHI